MTMWWSETGVHWGWAGCLLATVVLMAFWAAVFAALTSLLGTSRPHPRHTVPASGLDHAAKPAGITITGELATAAPPQCR